MTLKTGHCAEDKGNLRDGTCQRIPLVCNTHRPCWFTVRVNAGVKRCSNRIFGSLLWCSSLKGNGLENLNVFKRHFSSRLHGHPSADRLTWRVTSLLLSHKRYGPNKASAFTKTSYRDSCSYNLHIASVDWVGPTPTAAPIVIVSSIYRMWNWSLHGSTGWQISPSRAVVSPAVPFTSSYFQVQKTP